ncbi:hypothetical protein ACWEN6_23865 [Sphaerisporangium sp. NPDC004334]
MVFASLACAGFLCSGLGSQLAPLIARLAGRSERAVLASLGTGTGGLLLLAATATSTGAPATALAATGYGVVYLGRGLAGPSENDLLHRRVTRAGRATALSVQSLALQLAGAAHRCPAARPGPLAAGRHRTAHSSPPVDPPRRTPSRDRHGDGGGPAHRGAAPSKDGCPSPPAAHRW